MVGNQGYIGTLPSMSQLAAGARGNSNFNLTTQVKTANEVRENSGIVTYGALILPFDVTRTVVVNTPKQKTSFKNKLLSAFKNAPNNIKNAITNPTQTFNTLSEYMTDERNGLSIVTSKFSGIAVAQALMDGNVSAREAADYLFMGFAPALGVQGSLMGYSGLSQMKDALVDGNMNVGAMINGFTRTLKGGIDLKDMLTNKQNKTSANVIQFDLTASHSENYQSETPDRRVQSGQSLNEFVHNMPETIEVQCALQENKRYSKAEFRAILQYLRNRKDVVSLVLGDEMFDNLILTGFAPSHECTRSGMDYSLSFKKVNLCDVNLKTEVTVQQAPVLQQEGDSITTTTGGGIGNLNSGNGKASVGLPSMKDVMAETGTADVLQPSGMPSSVMANMSAALGGRTKYRNR